MCRRRTNIGILCLFMALPYDRRGSRFLCRVPMSPKQGN